MKNDEKRNPITLEQLITRLEYAQAHPVQFPLITRFEYAARHPLPNSTLSLVIQLYKMSEDDFK